MSSIEKAINKLGNQNGLKGTSVDMPAAMINPGAVRQGARPDKTTAVVRSLEIDFSDISAMGFLTPDDTTSSIAQEMRIVKRPILTKAMEDRGHNNVKYNLLAVTSALPGEGKTFSAINLAFSIAMEVDRTVLLVDADNARAGVSETLGFDADAGLSDLLVNPGMSINDVLIKTNVPNLMLMSAGTQKTNMTELLASEAMEHLVADLANHDPDRIVIFDSAPLAVTTEARVLASLVHQVLLVIEANGTSQKVVRDVVENLGRDKEIGILLNKTLSNNVTGYGYGSRS